MASPPKLILASASPRRSELLRNAGIPFEIQAPHVDESVRPREEPLAYAQRVARAKARTVHERFPNDFVLGADTIVIVDQTILGKPRDSADAARMLRLLSARSHRVITAICLVQPNAAVSRQKIENVELKTANKKLKTALEDSRFASTEVFFNPLREAEIERYIATGEPMDKAGAYAIQGIASRWIP